ncbi:hypothetical protein FIBSPDRAFT_1041015 [Athelia psychrophila]|uniref:Uncharacterized protein n=1 Tax=Athelia psychrophila TaxID=1759441 RepID=A0A166PB04_9AGAM|nr:hypothetical protein FIBSPDRAFT_1041015 [Fibularhizoctonia sp. CBS 109695]
MDEYPLLPLSRPILGTNNHDDEFNPHDLINEHLETHIRAGSENSLAEQAVRTSATSTASNDRGFAAGILSHFHHCAIPFAVRLPALLIAFGTLFLALSIVLWLSHRQYDHQNSFVPANVTSGILVREPASRGNSSSNEAVAVGLIISSVVTQFVALTAPVLLGTIAYRLGFDWGKASQELDHGKLPTQDQYGLIIDMFTMASIPTMWRTSSYILQRTIRRAKAPRMLLRGFFAVCILFALTRFIGLADVALHSTTSSIALPIAMATADTAYGTTINQLAMAQGSSELMKHEGVLTSQNKSLVNQVFTLNNQSQMAYIARLSADIPTDISFIAPTLGVESSCINITADCLSQSSPDPYGHYSAYNCSSAGYPDYHQTNESTVFHTLAVPSKYLSNLNATSGILSLNRNPFPVLSVGWRDGTCSGPYLGTCVAGPISGPSYLFLACNISVYDTVLQYSEGVYTMVNRTLSTPQSASIVTQPISVFENHSDDSEVPLVTTLADDIVYSPTTEDQELGEFVGADLSRLLLSYSAGYLSTNPAHAIANLGIITRYNATSLAITLLLVSLYSLLAFVIFGWASTARIEPASHLRLACEEQSHVVSTQGLVYNAQLRLTRPSTLIPQALYGWSAEHETHGISPSPTGYVMNKEVELFEGRYGRNRDRLAITWDLGVEGPRDVKTRMRAAGHDHDEEENPTSQSAFKYQDSASAMTDVASSSLNLPGAETSTADIPEVSNSHRQYRIPLSGRLPALMVSLSSSVLATSLICWLYIRRYRALDSGLTPLYPYITVKEPSKSSNVDADGTVLVGLLISSITTQFVSWTAPLLLVVVAYRVAIDWLEYSGRMNLPNLPTPQQYGHLINLFSIGGPCLLLEFGGYLRDSKNRMRVPSMLIGTYVTMVTIFMSTHIVGLADLALHSTTTSGTVSSVNVVDPLGSVYGTVKCPFDPSPFNDTVTYAMVAPIATTLEGIRTANRRSTVNSVLTYNSDDEMAYIIRVPALIPVSVSFIAPSLGISAQCIGITPNCTYSCGPNGICLLSNCIDYPDITGIGSLFTVDADQWSGSNLKNPFRAVWSSFLDGPPGNYQFGNLLSNSTGDFSFLAMACNITVYDIFLHYTNGSYTVVNKTTASGATTAYATYPLRSNAATSFTVQPPPIDLLLLSDLVEMNPSAADFAADFSPNVARLLLAFSAGVLQSAPAAQVMADGIVTRYPFIPLAIYLFSVYLYAFLALSIFIWVASAGRRSAGTVGTKKQVGGYSTLASDSGNTMGDESLGQARELVTKAQWHISQPSSLVAALFGGTREVDGGPDADINASEEYADDKRLAVGLHEQTEEDGSNRRLVYGVWEVQGFKKTNEE